MAPRPGQMNQMPMNQGQGMHQQPKPGQVTRRIANIFPQKSPIFSAKEPYISAKEPYISAFHIPITLACRILCFFEFECVCNDSFKFKCVRAGTAGRRRARWYACCAPWCRSTSCSAGVCVVICVAVSVAVCGAVRCVVRRVPCSVLQCVVQRVCSAFVARVAVFAVVS